VWVWQRYKECLPASARGRVIAAAWFAGQR